jgi:hypothetical protein
LGPQFSVHWSTCSSIPEKRFPITSSNPWKVISYHLILAILLLFFPPMTHGQSPVPDVKINASDGPVSLNQAEDNVSVSVQLDAAGRIDNADWFVAICTPFGIFFYTLTGWTDVITPIVQAPLQSLPNVQLMNFPASLLPSGEYVFYFAVDTERNGIISLEQLYFDAVEFTVLEGPYEQRLIDATAGGTLSVTNSRGDTITLTIPPTALTVSTTVKITPLDSPPTGPIEKNIFPGVRIEPDGLMLRQPALLRVQLAEEGASTDRALLFYRKQSDFVLPLGEQVAMGALLEGELYHFSDYTGGEPSETEVTEQSSKAAELEPPSDPYGWQGVADGARGLLGWAEHCMLTECNVDTTFLIDAARNLVERSVRDFLDLPIPSESSDAYIDAILNYEEMLKAISGDQTLRDTLEDRLAQSGGGPALFELEWWGIGVHSDGVDYSHLFKPKDRIPFRANVHEGSGLLFGGGTIVYDGTYPCYECECRLYWPLTVRVTGCLVPNPDNDPPWGDPIVEVETQEVNGVAINTRTCPYNVFQHESFRADVDHIYTWLFPLRDGAHAFDSNIGPPTLHIIHWPE